MEKLCQTAKSEVINFKLDYCCWIAPVRIGLMVTAYFNIVADLVCLIGIANEGLSPTITRVQEILIEDNVNKPIPVLAYATELGLNVLLLCAIYRRDLILMRVFMYYTIMAVVMSFLVYSIIIAAVPLELQVAIIFSTIFQIYIIFLVRSLIVEMKMEGKMYELPTLVMSSLVHEKVTPGNADPKNGQIKEVVTITEVPKKQEVSVTILPKQEKSPNEVKDIKELEVKNELKKDAEVKIETESKKKDADVTIETEPKKKDEKKIKEEKKNKEEVKKNKEEEKKKKAEEKKNKAAEKETKAQGRKDSKKDVKEVWLQTVNEHPKE